ncbi:permease [Vibrio sp. S9_S30]|uniref:permease n=1 Tax=Vibrio sp. S9_S30 TaxID=2720226 RepID=UPI001680F95F|nr:permease [Vibrio sp. S9_S30]MBD1558217.1 permease [Vibrio sp. S9_S30]
MFGINSLALQDTLSMFVFLMVELTILFLAISYLVGVIQMHISPEKIRSILSSKNGKGYVVAGFLGAVTPFCSCSTIPFLKGLLRAKAGFGTMMVFLFASPLLNPIIIGLFAITLGYQVTILYFSVAMGVSVLAGYSLEKFGFEKYIKPEVYDAPISKGCGTTCSESKKPESRWVQVWHSTWNDFKKVFPFLIGGIAIGSVLYGFMPTEFIVGVASKDNPLAIPVAAVIGIPLYIRAEAVIPLSAALAAKGMGLGAVMALIIGSAGASLTEIILLKSMFKNTLVVSFIAVILAMAIGAGLLHNVLF